MRGFILLSGIAGAVAASGVASAQMRITEYMYSGASEEFVEFTNIGSEPIDMTGWSYDDDSQTPGVADLSAFGIVQPGQSVVMTEADPEQFRADWGLDASCVIVGLITNNLGRNDEINLYDAKGNLVDRLTYGDQTFPGSIRTQNTSGWGQAYGIGLNDPYSFVFSRVGDLQGSVASVTGDVGSPCRHLLVNELRFSEVRIDQPDADNDEYVEIRGTAGVPVDGLTILVIGDGVGGSGVIEAVIDLAGFIPEDGHYLAVEETHTLAAPEQQDLVTLLNFENSDNLTFILVDGFSGALGDDLDADDDCSLDATPWINEYDRFALIEEDNPPLSTECHYATVTVGPDGTFVPGHAFLCQPSDLWSIGGFDPAIGQDTPGEPNAACPAPQCEQKGLRLNEIRMDQPGGDDDEYIEITGVPGTSLDGVCIVVIGDGGSTDDCGVVDDVINLTGSVIPESGYFLIAEDANTFGVTADLITSIGLENGDNLTFFLACGCDNVIIESDLDADNDGVLDSIPWEVAFDSVTVFGTEGVECPYSQNIADGGTTVPGHVLRCLDGDDWGVGELDPAIGIDTPGAPNADCIVPCVGDFDGSGDVGFDDLLSLLAVWGPCPGCPEDIDGNGEAGFDDLLTLLAAWGPC